MLGSYVMKGPLSLSVSLNTCMPAVVSSLLFATFLLDTPVLHLKYRPRNRLQEIVGVKVCLFIPAKTQQASATTLDIQNENGPEMCCMDQLQHWILYFP